MKVNKGLSILLVTITISASCSISAFASTVNMKAYNNSPTVNAKSEDTSSENGAKRYIVKFKFSGTDAEKIVGDHDGDMKHQFKHINAAVADMTPDNMKEMMKDSNIEFVEEDYPVKISAVNKTSSTKTSSSSYTNWGVGDIKADTAQNSGLNGKGVKIAIIDTGVASHSDLSVSGGKNVISGSTTKSYVDDNGHGTHVAGIINGQGLNGGVLGVAPGASIYAVKALDSDGEGYTSDIIAGIDWAIENKMDIISLSLGSSDSDTSLKNAVDTAYSDGLLVVAAAGNDGNSAGTGNSIEYPANYSSVIAVGAVDSSNTRAYFSSTGSKLEVSAPGVSIISTYLNGSYVEMSGTSMATPFVSGDLALLKEKYPTYTNAQLRNLLDSDITDLGSKGKDSLYGYGLIQAPSDNVTTTTVAIPTANVASGSYTSSQKITLSDTTSGVSIYYTLDGTTPTSKSTLYANPITISSTKTLKAIAIDASGNSSSVFSATYIIASTVNVATPTASLSAGTYTSAQTVTLSDTTSGVSIYYTLDGTTPTSKSTLCSEAISINSTKTLKAIAIDSNNNASAILTAIYVISEATSTVIPIPTASVSSGTYKAPLMVQLHDSYSKLLRAYYTLDGSTPTIKSTPYMGNIRINSSCTMKAIAVDISGNTSDVLSNTYTIEASTEPRASTPSITETPPLAPPVFSVRGGIFKSQQSVTIKENTKGVSIYYTTDGTVPSSKSTLYTGAITVKNSETLSAVAIDANGNVSPVSCAKFIIR